MDFITGRALREMEPATKMYGRLVALAKAAVEGQDVSTEQLTIPEALDTMVKWFCILFGKQFSPDDVYDHYPADRLIADLQRDNIERAYCMFKLEHGYCPSGMKESIASMYASYQARGYNHIASSRIEELLALPEFPEK